MKNATLAQGNQVLTLILQKQTSSKQLQTLIESGLLSDLLDANVQEIDRDKFQEAIGLKKTKRKKRVHRFVVLNVEPTQELVEKEMKKEFGEVDIVDWFVEDRIHFKGLVVGGGMLPQCKSIVAVTYTETEK